MTEEKKALVDLNKQTDILSTRIECPICGQEYFYGVPYANVRCKKCGPYRTDFKQDIYTKKARQINFLWKHNNEITFKADRDYADVLDHIKEDFTSMRCWNVSDITQKHEAYRVCKKCATCYNCYTCIKCGKIFEVKIRSKPRCPDCKSFEFKRTYIKQKEIDENKKDFCPHCKSKKIKPTINEKEKCHKCGSDTIEKNKTYYYLTINRKGGYVI